MTRYLYFRTFAGHLRSFAFLDEPSDTVGVTKADGNISPEGATEHRQGQRPCIVQHNNKP